MSRLSCRRSIALTVAIGMATSAVDSFGQEPSPPELHASVDQSRITVGEALLFTLRAVARSSDAVEITVAPFTGFEIVSRVERSELASVGGVPTRSTVLELSLRAVHPGRWKLGPARAVAGSRAVESPAITVDVAPESMPGTVTVGPRLRELLLRAPAPAPGRPSVLLLLSADSVRQGEQVDLVTAAWFPRDLRVQLRRPPTLQPPVVGRVWTYPQATPSGIAATRTVNGTVFDLFVAHQIVFPLVPGPIAIPAATLKYSTPQNLQFFSREERFTLSSAPATLAVAPLPADGRPGDFSGAVGAGLRLERRVGSERVRRGEPLVVELSLAGRGNLALWPAPALRWPSALRAYPDKVEERVESSDGLIGGAKVFRYLVVADSGDVLRLPAVRYDYYDLLARRYVADSIPALTLPVGGGAEATPSAAMPPPLLAGTRPPVAWRLWNGMPRALWIALLLLPPLVALGRGAWPRTRAAPAVAPPAGDLREAESRLERAIARWLPEGAPRSELALAAALRAGGGDPAIAARAAQIRARLEARRFGTAAGAGDDTAIRAEAAAVIAQLGVGRRTRRVGASALGWLLLVSLVSSPWRASRLEAQALPPERLYETGALRAAADAFAARAGAEPAVPAYWFNLGNAYYRLGQAGHAQAAWLRAARLAPRNRGIARALRLVPSSDAVSARRTWVPPATPEELELAGLALWLLGWAGWVARPRARDRAVVALVFATVVLGASVVLRRWYARPVGMVLSPTTLRLSPHGRAPAVTALDPGSAVLVGRGGSGWLLVTAPDGREGWIADADVALVGG